MPAAPRPVRRPRLAALLLLVVAAACADAPSPVAPVPIPRDVAADSADPAVVATRAALEAAAEGLLYTSEGDHPLTYWIHEGAYQVMPTAAAFRQIVGAAPRTRVEIVALDDFLARHIERVDPYDAAAVADVPRWEHLRETLRTSLRDVQVYRVGRIAIDCFLVGLDAAGNVVGLRTVAIET